MKVSKEINENTIKYAFQGLWTMDFCEVFEELIKQYLGQPNKIVIDMDEVIMVSVTGLRQITELRYKLINSGGSLKLINVDKKIFDKLLKLNYLDKMDVSIRKQEEGSWL